MVSTSGAPDKVHANVTPNQVSEIINDLRSKL
jgi:hypothetical protein